jgi:hypothetical protein
VPSPRSVSSSVPSPPSCLATWACGLPPTPTPALRWRLGRASPPPSWPVRLGCLRHSQQHASQMAAAAWQSMGGWGSVCGPAHALTLTPPAACPPRSLPLGRRHGLPAGGQRAAGALHHAARPEEGVRRRLGGPVRGGWLRRRTGVGLGSCLGTLAQMPSSAAADADEDFPPNHP